MSKEDTSSPTVATESLILSCVMYAHEGRYVGTVDIPGAFMHADMEGIVDMKLEDTMADMFAKLDPNLYRKHIRTENGKSVLYVHLKKPLYGTLQVSLLFWKKLTNMLEGWGFETNPYDRCVVNKTINGNQCRLLWHVDDLKISHVDHEEVTSVIKMLKEEFGKHGDISVIRGKMHDYLGMTLNYTQKGRIKFQIFDYIGGMLNELPNG